MVCTICRRGGKKCTKYVMKGHKVVTNEPAERFIYVCKTCGKSSQGSVFSAIEDRFGIKPDSMEVEE